LYSSSLQVSEKSRNATREEHDADPARRAIIPALSMVRSGEGDFFLFNHLSHKEFVKGGSQQSNSSGSCWSPAPDVTMILQLVVDFSDSLRIVGKLSGDGRMPVRFISMFRLHLQARALSSVG
jgi:hypothetical protein